MMHTEKSKLPDLVIATSGIGYRNGPDSLPPSDVPDGVMALVGYVNRLFILVHILWPIFITRTIKRIE